MSSPDQLRPRRRPTVSVDVGGVLVGSAHPIVVQSMTNTDTVDADATAIQVARLAHAGSQLVRVTVNTEEAAAASSVLTVTRTSCEPAWARRATWIAVASGSAVSVFVIDWTTIGWADPTRTPPTSTLTVGRRRGRS